VMLMSIAKTVAMPRDRIVGAGSEGEGEERQNYALRPLKFAQYIGQESLIHKLRIAVEAARSRQEPVDHMLLHGPPGLGKTTLAHVVANEVGAQVHVTNGPALTKGADLVGILTKLQRGDVLFIDEIHRLSAVVEEYPRPRRPRPDGDDPAAAVHADRGHDPHRPAHRPDARAVRHQRAH